MDKDVRYIQTIVLKTQQEIFSNNAVFREFLSFIPNVAEYSYEEQLQLFTFARHEKVFFEEKEWKTHGRIVSNGQKPIRIYDFEKDEWRQYYGLSQTQGVAFIQEEVFERFGKEVQEETNKKLAKDDSNTPFKAYQDTVVSQLTKQKPTRQVELSSVLTDDFERLNYGALLSAFVRRVKDVVLATFRGVKNAFVKRKEATYAKDRERDVNSYLGRGITENERDRPQAAGRPVEGVGEPLRRRESSREMGDTPTGKDADGRGLGETGRGATNQVNEPLRGPFDLLSEREQTGSVSESIDQGQTDGSYQGTTSESSGANSSFTEWENRDRNENGNSQGLDGYSETLHLEENQSEFKPLGDWFEESQSQLDEAIKSEQTKTLEENIADIEFEIRERKLDSLYSDSWEQNAQINRDIDRLQKRLKALQDELEASLIQDRANSMTNDVSRETEQSTLDEAIQREETSDLEDRSAALEERERLLTETSEDEQVEREENAEKGVSGDWSIELEAALNDLNLVMSESTLVYYDEEVADKTFPLLTFGQLDGSPIGFSDSDWKDTLGIITFNGLGPDIEIEQIEEAFEQYGASTIDEKLAFFKKWTSEAEALYDSQFNIYKQFDHEVYTERIGEKVYDVFDKIYWEDREVASFAIIDLKDILLEDKALNNAIKNSDSENLNREFSSAMQRALRELIARSSQENDYAEIFSQFINNETFANALKESLHDSVMAKRLELEANASNREEIENDEPLNEIVEDLELLQLNDEGAEKSVPFILPNNPSQLIVFESLFKQMSTFVPHLFDQSETQVSYHLSNGNDLVVRKENALITLTENYPRFGDEPVIEDNVLVGVYDDKQGVFVPVYQQDYVSDLNNASPAFVQNQLGNQVILLDTYDEWVEDVQHAIEEKTKSVHVEPRLETEVEAEFREVVPEQEKTIENNQNTSIVVFDEEPSQEIDLLDMLDESPYQVVDEQNQEVSLSESVSEDYWVVEFNEIEPNVQDLLGSKDYSGQRLTVELLTDIRKYDYQFHNFKEMFPDELLGYDKYYFDHIVNGERVENYRVDMGDGDQVNRQDFAYLYGEIDPSYQMDNSLLELWRDELVEKVNALNPSRENEVANEQNTPIVVFSEEPSQEIGDSTSQTTNESDHNNGIDTELFSYTNGKKSKFKKNVQAIRLLKQLDKEGRLANEVERLVLQQYTGWGGLSEAFDVLNKKWENEYQELQEILTQEEYKSAFESVLTAYYTDPRLVQGILQGVQDELQLAPKTILDPATGTGNFLRFLPKEWKAAQTYAVELDDLSSRLAKHLLSPEGTQLEHTGFENTTYQKNSLDLIVGNVPFNDIRITDKAYSLDNQDLLIHDYFMAKSIDLLEERGLMVFITSSGTLDKKDPTFREYLSKRANLLGAIRLPNNAFSQSAHTQVVSDIVIFQKDTSPNKERPNWVNVAPLGDESSVLLNQYFEDNPQNILGDIAIKNYRGKTLDVKAFDDMKIEGLSNAVQKAVAQVLANAKEQGQYLEQNTPIGVFSNNEVTDENSIEEVAQESVVEEQENTIKNNQNTTIGVFDEETSVEENETVLTFEHLPKPYQYFVSKNVVYYFEGDKAEEVTITGKRLERLKGQIALREITSDLLELQSTPNYSKRQLEELQKQLNDTYDDFVKKYGYLNTTTNTNVFKKDGRAALLLALEVEDKEKNEDGTPIYHKASIFREATIRPSTEITTVDLPIEALRLSLMRKGRVDFKYMQELMPDETAESLLEALKDELFLDPKAWKLPEEMELEHYQVRAEYLSGNVREKYEEVNEVLNSEAMYITEEFKEKIRKNAEALQSVFPEPIPQEDIGFSLASRWIPKEDIRDFVANLIGTGLPNVEVNYAAITGKYEVHLWGTARVNVKNTREFGTDDFSASEIIQKTLNLEELFVYKTIDVNGEQKREVNHEASELARNKREQIEQKFSEWLFSEPTRAKRLIEKYNRQFNNLVPRKYSGAELTFDGMNTEYQLRPHQKSVVERILFEGRALMAHEVGAGKTAAMITAGKYLKDMGMVHKPLYVVPNALTVQWAKEYYQFYPNANVLLVTKDDFSKKNRKKFLARIATGNYDAVIMGKSQFDMISISSEKKEAYLKEELEVIKKGLEQSRFERDNFSIKELMRKQRSIENALHNLSIKNNEEDILTFEELGVDFLFVDEAHLYKNLGVVTRLTQVAGISSNSAKSAQDMLLKVRFIQEQQNGRGVVFATGTPISNSMTEMFTMQRYLQPELLEKQGLGLFDNWVAQYGIIETNIEIRPEGDGYRTRQRLKKFNNLPELTTSFSMIADVVTSDMMELTNIPKLKGGKVHTIISEKDDIQEEYMSEFAVRAAMVRIGVDSRSDNMLKITNDGRLLAVDPRLLDNSLPNNEEYKISKAANNIYRIWKDTAEKRSTQIVFSDVGVPSDKFNVYDELKSQLVDMGIPSEEVAFIHDASNDKQRDELFEKVRTGEVRVIVGSTGKLGTGVNVQNKLIAAHHIDCPWKPSDIVQREGRIIRQGNENDEVEIYRYITKGTFDSYLWQIQEQKLTYISQIMTSNTTARSGDDIDESVLSAAEVKALATGNPAIARKMEIDNAVTRLQMLKKQWNREQRQIQVELQQFPNMIEGFEMKQEALLKDKAILDQNPMENVSSQLNVVVKGVIYTKDNREELVKVLEELYKDVPISNKFTEIGKFRGFPLLISRQNDLNNPLFVNMKIAVKGNLTYVANVNDVSRAILVMNNKLNKVPQELEENTQQLEETKTNFAQLQEKQATNVFPREAELEELLREQSALSVAVQTPSPSVSVETTISSDSIEVVEMEEVVEKEVEEQEDSIDHNQNTTIVVNNDGTLVEQVAYSDEFYKNRYVFSNEEYRSFVEDHKNDTLESFMSAYLEKVEEFTSSSSKKEECVLKDKRELLENIWTKRVQDNSERVFFMDGKYIYDISKNGKQFDVSVFDIRHKQVISVRLVPHLEFIKDELVNMQYIPSEIASDYTNGWQSELRKAQKDFELKFGLVKDALISPNEILDLGKLYKETANDLIVAEQIGFIKNDKFSKINENLGFSEKNSMDIYKADRGLRRIVRLDQVLEESSEFYLVNQNNIYAVVSEDNNLYGVYHQANHQLIGKYTEVQLREHRDVVGGVFLSNEEYQVASKDLQEKELLNQSLQQNQGRSSIERNEASLSL